MKARHLLTASEINDLNGFLDRALDSIGLVSQPEVVLKLLELSNQPESQMQDFARIIKTDHAITGRVLKLSNSAIFAQRATITSIERACLVLGLERLKAISLGFHLSRAAACGGSREFGRELWGQSVLRACLAGEAARLICPAQVPEAFVIGLMMDSAIPMMEKLIGTGYLRVLAELPSPGMLYRVENESLPFTHVDLVAALARRWKFPEVLAKPLAWHHTRPPEVMTVETTGRLHRIAYVVGMLELRHDVPGRIDTDAPDVLALQRTLKLSEDELRTVAARAASEYQATIGLFSEVAASLGDAEDVLELVQSRLIDAVDSGVETAIAKEQAAAPRRLIVAGQTVEIIHDPDGSTMAFLYDGRGQRLLSHRLPRGEVSAVALSEALGLSISGADDLRQLDEYLRSAA